MRSAIGIYGIPPILIHPQENTLNVPCTFVMEETRVRSECQCTPGTRRGRREAVDQAQQSPSAAKQHLCPLLLLPNYVSVLKANAVYVIVSGVTSTSQIPNLYNVQLNLINLKQIVI